MSLDEFLHNLHFNTEKIRPPDWEVDWEDAPLPYKLYRGLPVFPLSLEVPLTLEGQETPVKPDLRGIGDLLWYVYGITQLSQSASSSGAAAPDGLMQSFRRFVPSGGALYPNELYVYLKAEDLPHGVYHYDAAHHRLILLREGNYDSYLAQALGNRCDVSACFGTIFVSTVFWKNFFKYHNFAYRLQGLDAGALIGQLLEVAKRFRFESGVCFQFLDRALNHLLGLAGQEESVYAVIPLSAEPSSTWFADRKVQGVMASSEKLCQELTAVPHENYDRSDRVAEYPMIIKMNEASMMESTGSFQRIEKKKRVNGEGQWVALPHVERLSYDLASVCRKRYSLDTDFILRKVSQQKLAALLKEATDSFAYRNDLDEAHEGSQYRVSLYGCMYGVEGIQNGAFCYDAENHRLRKINAGDYRSAMQQGSAGHNVNLFQVPLCLHVAGEMNFLKTSLGYRGYRIQQMEAGMLVQRLLLTASALGMGGHPLLGFEPGMCDELYKMKPQGKTSLIQVPVGHYHPRPWLKGMLHS
ncbi:SagB family peptide dehydrogenase [Fictibacillus terranigra]|uniref:SagB family peptide dehydrogenase n=1 Tax=Fictibacillus terranigra TaxID=3058424 RepID=A0ABT8EDC3_9BACL|nr:SagB family peptide dehydrogenase [Fictibacillus sp. CENA-BCM004]MDN4075875.1 SagB family peptide dehydrogenase [Fictibacillus sp. CENA-BCM004]